VLEAIGEMLIAGVEDRSAFGCVVAGALCIGFAVVAALCWQAGNADGATVFLAAIPALIGLRILRSFRLG
jgi:hypothetical protein